MNIQSRTNVVCSIENRDVYCPEEVYCAVAQAYVLSYCRVKREDRPMEFLYVAGALMMIALALKIGFIIHGTQFAWLLSRV